MNIYCEALSLTELKSLYGTLNVIKGLIVVKCGDCGCVVNAYKSQTPPYDEINHDCICCVKNQTRVCRMYDVVNMTLEPLVAIMTPRQPMGFGKIPDKKRIKNEQDQLVQTKRIEIAMLLESFPSEIRFEICQKSIVDTLQTVHNEMVKRAEALLVQRLDTTAFRFVPPGNLSANKDKNKVKPGNLSAKNGCDEESNLSAKNGCDGGSNLSAKSKSVAFQFTPLKFDSVPDISKLSLGDI